ncbi:glycosyltransferase family 2 protein [Lysobacter sp.]|uniref:glycosyltransferase family 2 protein n=1 Tax=Lysobacter sp. TaxID=72226 RepID=UPI002D5FF604|nr:glycosyltransferase family 2 protein [Lysobacter sp.]HZX78222.1 glycosyltransferase family 2 protein [Lysobacter sp.]
MTYLAEKGDGSERIAVIIPCYNEVVTVAKVVHDFRQHLPGAEIVVLDNDSTDGTSRAAERAGARVLHVGAAGKGNVVRRAFADVEADIYVLVDGDDTYSARCAPYLIGCLLQQRLDMVVAARVSEAKDAYRLGHRFGNRLLTGCVAWLFGRTFTDMLSGYRVFSRRYVRSFPAHASGFEIETELNVHALQLRMPVAEVPTPYGARPPGSSSKLNTYRDGIRILRTIAALVHAERPLLFFGAISIALLLAAIALAAPLLPAYLATGLVPRLPTALMSVALALTAMVSLACGLILNNVTRGRVEAKHLAYLSISSNRVNG